jgi:hypothetical protein
MPIWKMSDAQTLEKDVPPPHSGRIIPDVNLRPKEKNNDEKAVLTCCDVGGTLSATEHDCS